MKIKKSVLKELVREVLEEEQLLLTELGQVLVKNKKTGNIYYVSRDHLKSNANKYEKPSKEEKRSSKGSVKKLDVKSKVRQKVLKGIIKKL